MLCESRSLIFDLNKPFSEPPAFFQKETTVKVFRQSQAPEEALRVRGQGNPGGLQERLLPGRRRERVRLQREVQDHGESSRRIFRPFPKRPTNRFCDFFAEENKKRCGRRELTRTWRQLSAPNKRFYHLIYSICRL